eukprot:9696208-Alexandrium_andersonii.AAC.1
MSASLVGSEMCIRDRTSTAPEETAIRPAIQPAIGCARSRRSSRELNRACLLYTSDAADDM